MKYPAREVAIWRHDFALTLDAATLDSLGEITGTDMRAQDLEASMEINAILDWCEWAREEIKRLS